MPSNYTTITGDTPQDIAINYYGDGSQYVLILQANPDLQGVAVPIISDTELAAGQDIIIPDLVDPSPAESEDIVKTTSQFDNTVDETGAENPDEVQVIINGQTFKFFNGFSLSLAYDKLANEFSFTAPFDPDIQEIRDAFKPIYQPTDIYIGGKLVLKGQSAARPVLEPNRNAVNVSGYTITGTLSKTAISDPFEFKAGSTFADIITDIARRFGLAVVIDATAKEEADKPYEERVVFSNTARVGGKLTRLAQGRGLILSSTFNGRLRVTKPNVEGETVQAFVSGDESTTINIVPAFNADALSTSYIAYAPESAPVSAGADSASLKGIKQPNIIQRMHAIIAPEGANIDVEAAVRGERGRSYGEWLKINVDAVGWRDRNGNLYQPNTLVTALAPRAMIYDELTLFVRNVTLNKSNNRKSARLELILPQALSGLDLDITI